MVWIEIRDPNYYRNVSPRTTDEPIKKCSIDDPAPCVMASGMRGATPLLVSNSGPIPEMPEIASAPNS